LPAVFYRGGCAKVNMASDLDDVSKKSSRSKRSKRRIGGSGSGSGLSSIQLGLLLSLGVVIVYMYGFYSTISSLPGGDAAQRKLSELQAVGRRLGRNFNLARPSESLEEEFLPDGVVIPRHEWPVTIQNDDVKNWDTLVHPGDNVTVMTMPKFWSAPIHNGKLMTRSTAMEIGSCIERDPRTGKFNRGDDCPVNQRTIYVGIASYRDFQCRQTVESIFLSAAYPERIRVGVVDQIVHGEDPRCDAPQKPCTEDPNQALCKYSSQVDVYEMEARLSIGPVFARHIGYRLYRGEYYATQSDAHVTYTRNWDVDIVSQIESTGNEMAVLSTYLTDIEGSIDENGDSLRDTRPIMCNTVYEGGAQGMHLRHASQPERYPSIHGMPQLQPWWAAGYSFSRGHFVVNVPYDWLQPMIFQGEEMSIGIRGFTVGYDYYAPERSVCFHHYAHGKNAAVRNKVHHFWENDNMYAGTGRSAMKRLLGIVHMNPEDPVDSWSHVDENIYGLGGVRTCEKFYETFGINVVDKKIEKHLCQFVDSKGKMHLTFQPKLREDGMGIDYSTIEYKFTDPFPGRP
jgi:[Skp1-protein]-hydroxyproline N-acetylglucosaminyltransferase